MPVRDHWDRMTKAELKADLWRQWRAQGRMQSDLYKLIEKLEMRIGEQRKEINRLQDERERLVARLPS